MKKLRRFYINVLSLTVSIVALLTSLCYNYDKKFDSSALLVGILAILVAVLIGWNIYAALDIKEQLKSLQKWQVEQEKTNGEIKQTFLRCEKYITKLDDTLLSFLYKEYRKEQAKKNETNK